MLLSTPIYPSVASRSPAVLLGRIVLKLNAFGWFQIVQEPEAKLKSAVIPTHAVVSPINYPQAAVVRLGVI